MRTRWALLAVALVAGAVGCSSSAPGDGSAARRSTNTTASASTKPDEPNSAASTGCVSKPVAPGRSVVHLVSGGRTRSYIRYVPKSGPDGPAPLVVDFTAYSPASLEQSFSGFTEPDAHGKVKADEVGAVVVMPEPVNGDGLLTWNTDHTKGWTDDQRFVTDLLDDVGTHACIDTKRVLAMGFAIGAVMASTVACAQPERITALATVSGLWNPPGCAPSKHLPVISFHGTDDHFLPFTGGVGDHVGNLHLSGPTTAGLTKMATRPGAVASSTAWAKRNGCSAGPTTSPVVATVQRMAWTSCAGGADVDLYVIAGGHHAWPGSNGMAAVASLLGAPTQAISATDLIWTFFTDHDA